MQNLSNRKREMKRTGFLVSELGFGAWGIGGKGVGSNSAIEAEDAILEYVNAGGNLFDTAITYGDSEAHIGKTLKRAGLSNKVFIATKSKKGETADSIPVLRQDLEISLNNLQREYVDIFYLHLPPEEDDIMDMALSELEKFKKEGKIRAIGASIKGPAVTDATVRLCKKYIDTGRVDAIQLVYSILRQKNLEAIEYAYKNDVAIIARTTLESGFLTGKYAVGTRFASDDHRSRWNGRADEMIQKVEKIKEDYLGRPFKNISQLAIQFAMAPEGVTSSIVGAKNVGQLHANMESSLLKPIDITLLTALKKEFGGCTEKANPE